VRRYGGQLAAVVVLGGFFVLLAHPFASAASDLWGNVAPASPLGAGGLFGRYPLDHYTLDQHFDAVSASLTGGVDVSGVPPMIAYFLTSILWALTSFLANALISLFSFAFSLDLVNGSQATGGAGALAPVSAAIHSIYANVFGAPWLVLAIAVVGIWAMWKALVQRRYSETAGALALSLIYVVVALFFVAQPGTTIGGASKLTNQMSEAFLSISDHGDPSGGAQAKDDAANQLFELLVYEPWVVLDFGGLEHCAVAGTGEDDSDPDSVAVRPLSQNPSRDTQLARRLQSGTEVTADGKVCVNNANKYASHFLHFGLGTDERDDEYDALDHGDSSKLPDADSAKGGYQLGVTDKPATDAMEEGGQYQRLLIAIVVFLGELGAFCLLGSLSVGIILAQVLLLLLLAFAPVALVAAAVPGRGHAFFKGWLEKLAGYLLRKAAYSLILATLLAVNGALASATAQLGWLMSFGLQALFFWAVFLQRKSLTEGLIGVVTGTGAPGRDGSLRVLALYAGARTMGRPLRGVRRSARSATEMPGRVASGISSRLSGGGKGAASGGPGAPAPRFGTSYSAPVGGGRPSLDAPGPTEHPRSAAAQDAGRKGRPGKAAPAEGEPSSAAKVSAKGSKRRQRQGAAEKKAAAGGATPKKGVEKPSPAERPHRPQPDRPAPGAPPARAQGGAGSESGLSAELRAEREGGESGSERKPPARAQPQQKAEPKADAPTSPPRRGRRRRKGPGR
jgi:hypothetical protein